MQKVEDDRGEVSEYRVGFAGRGGFGEHGKRREVGGCDEGKEDGQEG